MRIALLNLPLDNNYGGNLQRYALMKVLQDLGHGVTHINLKSHYRLPWYKAPYSYPKRIILKYILRKRRLLILQEKAENKKMEEKLKLTRQFYDKYINHTSACVDIKDICRECGGKYDAYVVGSDQVWRKDATSQIGIENYFLRFTLKERVKRYAYGISFGIDNSLLGLREIEKLRTLYGKFNAVSVREASALELLKQYGWNNPKAQLCLDPTLLLETKDYLTLIEENNCNDITQDKIFAYILDRSKWTDEVISEYKSQMQKNAIEIGLDDTPDVSIPQWLNNIRLADFVITDSYHGVVFSIIFHKPFKFLGNIRRGNTRIDSLFRILNVKNVDGEVREYGEMYNKLNDLKIKSLLFLRQNLSMH